MSFIARNVAFAEKKNYLVDIFSLQVTFHAICLKKT